jgi:ABC-type antimicrobial peptide transport system permease subunit
VRFPGSETPYTIIGVVADVKWGGLAEATRGALYLPATQADPGTEARVVIRASGAPDAIVASLRDVVASIDDATPVADIRTLEQRIADSAAAPRFASILLGLFAILALTLGAVGIYGVIAYAVGRRGREFGIRMALGARATEVRALVLGQGLRLGLAGVALGLVGALAAGRALRSMLYGIGPADPVTFALVPILLLLVALAAAWLPAHRATRVAPMRVLRD